MPATAATSMKLTHTDHMMIQVICERHDCPTMAEAIRFALSFTVAKSAPGKKSKKSKKEG